MAVTIYSNGYHLTAAGDTISPDVIVEKIYIHGGSSAGDFEFKDADGNDLIPIITAAVNVDEVIDYPFGRRPVKGLELDAVPTGGLVDIIVG